jgi:phage terminase Nu1 subunit (DNA packaging protein)
MVEIMSQAAQRASEKARTGRRYTIPQLAINTGYSEAAIRKMRSQGMPVAIEGRGRRPMKIDLAQFIHFLLERERAKYQDSETDDISEYKRRKAKADAEAAEINLAVRRGDLVEIESVERVVTAAIMNARSRMLALPTKMTPRVHGLEKKEIEIELKNEIETALTELANIDPADFIDAEVLDEMDAAAEAHSVGVG